MVLWNREVESHRPPIINYDEFPHVKPEKILPLGHLTLEPTDNETSVRISSRPSITPLRVEGNCNEALFRYVIGQPYTSSQTTNNEWRRRLPNPNATRDGASTITKHCPLQQWGHRFRYFFLLRALGPWLPQTFIPHDVLDHLLSPFTVWPPSIVSRTQLLVHLGRVWQIYRPANFEKQESRRKTANSVLRAILGGMQFTLYATRRTPQGASRLVQAMSACLVKPRGAPSRHGRDASFYGRTTTAMHKLSTPLRTSTSVCLIVQYFRGGQSTCSLAQ